MIKHIQIKNFKSFRDVSVKLGPMNIFVGPNAGGKSNFFDALRVLQGIGYGFTLHEILDGKPKSATSEVWESIRGGSERAAFARNDENEPTSFEVTGELPIERDNSFQHVMAFFPKRGRLGAESLKIARHTVYDSSPGRNHPAKTDLEVLVYPKGDPELGYTRVRLDEERPILTQMAHGEMAEPLMRHAVGVARMYADMQRVAPEPSLLREYSKAYEIKRMGERGENFAALIKTICADTA
jgi:predicted ATPase